MVPFTLFSDCFEKGWEQKRYRLRLKEDKCFQVQRNLVPKRARQYHLANPLSVVVTPHPTPPPQNWSKAICMICATNGKSQVIGLYSSPLPASLGGDESDVWCRGRSELATSSEVFVGKASHYEADGSIRNSTNSHQLWCLFNNMCIITGFYFHFAKTVDHNGICWDIKHMSVYEWVLCRNCFPILRKRILLQIVYWPILKTMR